MPYKDPEKQKEFQREHLRKKRLNNIQELNKLKESGCVVCGEREPCCVGFHHLGNKGFTIGKNTHRNINRLLEEAKKCTVLCHNCHAKLHYGVIELPIGLMGYRPTEEFGSIL